MCAYHDARVAAAEAVNGIVNYTLCVAALQRKFTNEWEAVFGFERYEERVGRVRHFRFSDGD